MVLRRGAASVTDVYIPDEQGMLRAGRRLAGALSAWLDGGGPYSVTGGALFFLNGQLGAGKTTLVRGLLRALGVEGAVRSPTYTLIEPYEVGDGPRPKRVFHLDLYRLADPEELDYLGWREALGDGGLLLIEWPERGAGVLPPPDLYIDLAMRPPGRVLTLSGRGPWRRTAEAAAQAMLHSAP